MGAKTVVQFDGQMIGVVDWSSGVRVRVQLDVPGVHVELVRAAWVIEALVQLGLAGGAEGRLNAAEQAARAEAQDNEKKSDPHVNI